MQPFQASLNDEQGLPRWIVQGFFPLPLAQIAIKTIDFDLRGKPRKWNKNEQVDLWSHRDIEEGR